MASNDEKIIYKLDLDAEAFMKAINSVNDRLGSLEKTAKHAELPLLFANAKIAVEAFKVAVEVVEKAMEVVFDGEKVAAIEKQFDNLAASAGMVGEKLREGLVSASGGLVDDTKLLEIASQAIVTMGERAGDLERVMGAARKATSAFGGDLAQNFETFTRAISTGNVRMLRQYGIVVDNDRAIRAYAKSIGVTVDALTEQEKKTAIGNAALAQAESKYKNIKSGLKPATEAWTQLKVAVEDAKETIEKILAKVFGPFFASVFREASKEVKALSDNVKLLFSDDSSVKAKALEGRIESLSKKMASMKDGPKEMFNASEYEALKTKLKEYESQLEKIKELQAKEPQKEKEKPVESDEQKSARDAAAQKRLAHEANFQKELDSIRDANAKKQMQMSQSVEEVDRLSIEAKTQRELEFDRVKTEIQNKVNQGDLTALEGKKLIAEQEKAMALDLQAIDEQSYSNRTRALQNYLNNAGDAFDKLAAQQKLTAMQMAGQQGQAFQIMNTGVESFKNNYKKSMMDLATGNKSASDVIKGIFFNMLGDMAEKQGDFVLASSIFPPNPLGIAAAGALFALSGVLHSMGGGGGSSGGGGGGGAVSYSGDAPGYGQTPTSQQVAPPQKGVTIQVQGSYFETEQTKQRLMEMIRDQTDATDFKYQQIGSK